MLIYGIKGADSLRHQRFCDALQEPYKKYIYIDIFFVCNLRRNQEQHTLLRTGPPIIPSPRFEARWQRLLQGTFSRDELVGARGERFSEKIFWALSLVEKFFLMCCFGWTFALKILWKENLEFFFLRKWDVDVPALETTHPSILLSFEHLKQPPWKLTNHPRKIMVGVDIPFPLAKWSFLLGTNSLDFQGCKPGMVGPTRGKLVGVPQPWISRPQTRALHRMVQGKCVETQWKVLQWKANLYDSQGHKGPHPQTTVQTLGKNW